MANRKGTGFIVSYEGEIRVVAGFVALDGSSNVIGYAPTATVPSATGPYTRLMGAQIAIGPAGGVITQPHTAAGTYIFTLDEPYMALLNADVQLTDQGAVQTLARFVDANVSGSTSGVGKLPGNNTALAPQTVRVLFRTNAAGGALANPVASTGFWLTLWLAAGRGMP